MKGVTGLLPGNPMKWLPLELATSVFPLTPSMRRRFDYGDPTHDISRTGERIDVPKGQLIEELRRYGGHITFGDRTYVVQDARIHALILRPEALSRPFLAESDIEARLGPPSSVIGANTSSTVRHYADSGLTVAWRVHENRLGDVTVGSRERLLPPITRVAVLRNWLSTVDRLKDGLLVGDGLRSTMIRHRRLHALLEAFELGSPAEFSKGAFLKRPFERYPLSVAALRGTPYSPYFDEHDLRHLFWRLLSYRRAATRLWTAASYDEAGASGALTVIRVTSDVNRHLAGALTDIDDMLLEMISPTDRIFSEAELITRFGYVDDSDLYEALADEW